MTSIIRQSLSRQILLLIVGVTALTVAASTLVSVQLGRQTKQAMFRNMTENGEQVSSLLRQTIEKPMLIGDDATTTREFTYLAEKFPSAYVAIASFDGTVTYSTSTSHVRKQVTALYDPHIADLYKIALQGLPPAGQILTLNGKENYVQAIPITNELSCYHCHGMSQKVLGVMVVQQDVSRQMSDFTHGLIANVLVLLIGCSLLAFAIFIFVRNRVSLRVKSLAVTSDEIIAGNFKASFKVRGEDELAHLSQNLEAMVQQLKERLGFSRGIMLGIAAPFVVVDITGAITYLNEQFMNFWELSGTPDDFYGKTSGELFHGTANKKTLLDQVLVEKKDLLGIPIALTDAQDNKKFMRITASPLRDLDENLIGACMLVSDETEINAQQGRILALNERITVSVQEAQTISKRQSTAFQRLREQIHKTAHSAQVQDDASEKTLFSMQNMNSTLDSLALRAKQTT